jgi:CheY-like chemotaxis protein
MNSEFVRQSLAQDAGRRPSVLVVEKDADVRGQSVHHLTEFGFEVRAVTNGEAALEVLDSEAPLDLVFTDVIMPGGITGFGVADAAVARRPGIKIMFITGYHGTGTPHGALRHRGAPLLGKPYTRKELAAAVQAVLEPS